MARTRVPAKPTPRVKGAPADAKIIEMEPAQFAALKLAEVRRSRRNAERHKSWVAAARLHSLEVEMFDKSNELAKDTHDPDEDLTPEQLLENILLPAVAQWPRPYIERLYLECLDRLGIEQPNAEA